LCIKHHEWGYSWGYSWDIVTIVGYWDIWEYEWGEGADVMGDHKKIGGAMGSTQSRGIWLIFCTKK